MRHYQTMSFVPALRGRGARLKRIALAMALVTATAALSCSEQSTEPVAQLQELDPAGDWVAEYRGTGQGHIDGQPAFISNAVLTIAFDAVDDASSECPNCITVQLDDFFFLTNVAVESFTDLDLSYRDGVVLRTLLLHRPLLGVEKTNLLEVSLTVGNFDAPAPIVELEYLLERP